MSNQNPNTIVLHRWADREGNKLCAMSAVSKSLGYTTLSDTPEGVDPGIAALVNLLNDRANDKARQLLVSRLDHIPNTGQVDICWLMANVYFPQTLEANGRETEANAVTKCKDRRAMVKTFTSLGERFLRPDGAGYLASGCVTLAAALKTKDPTTRDILAVSAASRIVSYETDGGWFELLHLLDYALGLADYPFVGEPQLSRDYHEYFGGIAVDPEAADLQSLITEEENRPYEEVYDFGIKVQWFPALVEKFPDRLEEIAEKILDEVAKIGSTTIYMHRFPFGDEEVMIVTSWDDYLNVLFADADLVAYMDAVGKLDVEGDGEALTVLVPVPASDAGYVH